MSRNASRSAADETILINRPAEAITYSEEAPRQKLEN